eukprot:98931-Chlamydomonas_euryale.AAC.2
MRVESGSLPHAGRWRAHHLTAGRQLAGGWLAAGGWLVAAALGTKRNRPTTAQGVLVGPHEANVQTYSSRSAFLCALFYLLACKWPATAVMTQEVRGQRVVGEGGAGCVCVGGVTAVIGRVGPGGAERRGTWWRGQSRERRGECNPWCVPLCTLACVDVWMDGWMDGRMDGWMDGGMDG